MYYVSILDLLPDWTKLLQSELSDTDMKLRQEYLQIIAIR